MKQEQSYQSWRWLIVVIIVLLIAVLAFFFWQHKQSVQRTQKAAEAAAAVKLAAPTVSTVSVADFPVGKTISQEGSLQGPLSGKCGNIAWHDLSPSAEANLRKLCPAQKPTP
ncbi:MULTISPECIES: hypothetical protein [Acidithiobacillus]|jgi:type II secretory pathway pseudopilin PulG|uniref:hypothetical protein n=1 Tax=Acidithiobacillus TaxID=119977 RepID=UPI00187AFF89|nr:MULTISPECIES: hypothetical protein [Acidithiobacillus]MBE7566411.1 hypothetical protein [Acidithiobacillus sp. HP-11]MBU2750356.1 hypothetical protein [Acidithiobacillus thiooxidans]MBU2794845.1 hypothetical protein [Acidithiobacillus thiooxidans]